MRILVATPYVPWPLNSGGNAAQFATLKCLMADHDFVVVCPVTGERQRADLAAVGAELPRVRFVGVPIGDETGGRLSRSTALRSARRLYRAAREVLLQPGQGAPLPAYPFAPLPGAFIAAVQAEIAKGVDLCQAEFAEMMPLGAWFPAHLPKVFIHHQIHFIYAQRFIQARGDADGYAGYLESIIRAQEIAYLKHFDSVVTFSREDREILQPYLPGADLVASPFPLPADIEITSEPPAPSNGSFCFVASEAHLPNRDALRWLVEKIWPKITAALPAARLNVIGDWSEETRKAMGGPNIHFTGFVPVLSTVMRGSALLVPLQIGSGIRVKILAAQALGVPVVTTRVGGEGLVGADGREMLIRDTVDDFAAAAVELTRRPDLWQTLSVAGKESVLKHYSSESVRARRNEIYLRLSAANKSGSHSSAAASTNRPAFL